MAAQALDVWFVSAEQVYRGVPFQVAAGWVEQGRLSAADKVRPTKTNDAWVVVSAHPLLADYLPLKVGAAPAGGAAVPQTEQVEAPEPEGHTKSEPDDDDVDMIPLIDVSLVLLVFFLMTTAAASNDSPVQLAEATQGMEIKPDDPAVVTIQMDLRESGEAFYALRVGTGRTIKPEDNNLLTLQEVKSRLDAILPQFTTPPEVRIACHQEVKHVRVREVVKELEPYQKKGVISVYQAEVNQKPE
jgi:biopolymer transport protein ExbD